MSHQKLKTLNFSLIKTDLCIAKVFLKCLFHLGLCDRVTKDKLSLTAWIICATVNIFTIHVIASGILNITAQCTMVNVMLGSMDVFKALLACYVINSTLHSGNLIRNLLRTYLKNCPTKRDRLTFLQLINACFMITTCLGASLAVAKAVNNEGYVQAYIQHFLYNCDYLKERENLGRAMVGLNMTFYYYVTHIINYVYQATFCFAVESLRLKVHALADDFSDARINAFELAQRHTKLFRTVQELNFVSRWILCAWLIDWVLTFYCACFFIYKSNFEPTFIVYDFARVLAPFTLFTTMSMMSNCTSLFLRMCHLRATNQNLFLIEKQTAEVYLQRKLRTAVFHFTVFKSAILNGQFVDGLVLFVLSYSTFAVLWFI